MDFLINRFGEEAYMNYTSLESKIKNLIDRKSEGNIGILNKNWHKDNEDYYMISLFCNRYMIRTVI